MSRESSFEFLHLVHVVKEPNTFKHSNNVRDHLKNVNSYFDQTKCPENLKLQLFLKYLSLSVLEDLKLQLEYNDKVDLEWYEDKMLELYDDRRSLVTILVDLVDIKQKRGETTMDFASRIKDKVQNKKIPINMQENIKLQLFINGLCKKNYSKALQILNPKSLIEAVNMLRLDFNIIEKDEDPIDSSGGNANNYLEIIKSLCDKINPSPQDQNNHSSKKPEKYEIDNSDFHPIRDDHKLLFKDIMDKLEKPDCKGIIIAPKCNNRFKIVDIPLNDIIVGIPYENEDYEVITCKKESGYVISDSLTKKHTVYKLPSDETLVLSTNGKISYVKKPTLIGPSKHDRKMEIIPLPASLVNDNKIPLSCDEIISILELSHKKEIAKRTSKTDLFDETAKINTQSSNTSPKSEDNLNPTNIDQNPPPDLTESKTITPSVETKTNNHSPKMSNESCNIDSFKVSNRVLLENISIHNTSVEYLSQFVESPLKESDGKFDAMENTSIKTNISSPTQDLTPHSSSANSTGQEDLCTMDPINSSLTSNATARSDPAVPQQTIKVSKETTTEKTIVRFH